MKAVGQPLTRGVTGPFSLKRRHKAEKRDTGHSGLGLSLVKALQGELIK